MQAFFHPDLERVILSRKDFAVWTTFFVAFNVVFLTLWTLLDPWQWLLTIDDSRDRFGRSGSYYICRNEADDVSPYAVIIICFHSYVLLQACWWSFRTSELETEYKETEYIGYTLILLLETVAIGATLVTLLDSTQASRFFLMSGSVFLICMVLLGVLIAPKIIAHGQEDRLPDETYAVTKTQGEIILQNEGPGPLPGHVRNESLVSIPGSVKSQELPEDVSRSLAKREPSMDLTTGLKVIHHPKVSSVSTLIIFRSSSMQFSLPLHSF